MENYVFLLVLKIDCTTWTDLFADSAFAFCEEYAVIFINSIFKGYSLRVLDIDGLSFVKFLVEFIKDLLWAFFSA
jgi:hypothetical protein